MNIYTNHLSSRYPSPCVPSAQVQKDQEYPPAECIGKIYWKPVIYYVPWWVWVNPHDQPWLTTAVPSRSLRTQGSGWHLPLWLLPGQAALPPVRKTSIPDFCSIQNSKMTYDWNFWFVPSNGVLIPNNFHGSVPSNWILDHGGHEWFTPLGHQRTHLFAARHLAASNSTSRCCLRSWQLWWSCWRGRHLVMTHIAMEKSLINGGFNGKIIFVNNPSPECNSYWLKTWNPRNPEKKQKIGQLQHDTLYRLNIPVAPSVASAWPWFLGAPTVVLEASGGKSPFQEQKNYGKWPLIVDFPMKNGDFQ